MTIMPVEVGAPAEYQAYGEAVDRLAEYAAELGLQLVGWKALPANAPKITIDPETMAWTCPHCGNESEDLEVVFISDSQVSASPVKTADEDSIEIEQLQEMGLVGEHHWQVSEPGDLAENSGPAAYCCVNCCGWVEPDKYVVVTY